jgi:hypothetical protein
VLGADTMLTQLRALQVSASLDPFRIVFSASPFPGALEAQRLEEEDGGVWYEAKLGDQVIRGWLCGHFFDYFATAPDAVYVKAESLGSVHEFQCEVEAGHATTDRVDEEPGLHEVRGGRRK